MRIGLGAGESTVQGGDYFGMPSIEAARLCDKAPADGILVSPTVRMLAARLDDIRFDSVGELELKGFSEPIEAFAVPWRGSRAGGGRSRRSLAVAGAVARRPGRRSWVARRSGRSWSASVAKRVPGPVRSALVSGEPGIGKSRLASFSARGAHAERFAVLWGACSEELAVPYEPWISVCSQLVEHAPSSRSVGTSRVTAASSADSRASCRDGFPEVPEPESLDPETERFLLFSAVTGALVELAASMPVCLVLDDLHWADGASVALLKHVVSSTDGCALQVIVTFRDSDLSKDHPLGAVLADLRRFEGVERIALHGFGAAEVSEVMAAAAGHELDADGLVLAGEIASETGGNPFFVGEVLRSLVESGRLLYDAATERWSVDRSAPLGLPESVRDVIANRVGRLGVEAREVLTLAAVIGRSFELELLVQLTDTTESDLLDRLEAAVAASLVDESTEQVGRFRFVHSLINQTLYETLGATRRSSMHHRVALALEELSGRIPASTTRSWRCTGELPPAIADKAVTDARRASARSTASPPRSRRSSSARSVSSATVRIPDRCTADRPRRGAAADRRPRVPPDAPARRSDRVIADSGSGRAAALANTRGRSEPLRPPRRRPGRGDRTGAGARRRSRPARQTAFAGVAELLYEHDHHHRRELAEQALALARELGKPCTAARVLIDCFRRSRAPTGWKRRSCAPGGADAQRFEAADDPRSNSGLPSGRGPRWSKPAELERAETGDAAYGRDRRAASANR